MEECGGNGEGFAEKYDGGGSMAVILKRVYDHEKAV
jgi:hypothetical protein